VNWAEERFQRYAPIVDDFGMFIEACSQPLPRAVWLNPLKASVDDVTNLIMERVPDARPLPWLTSAWRLPARTKPGLWPEYRMGWIHCQEEVALWAVPMLNATSGERVLDLCAAPGNKTAQIAVSMHDSGVIVANERRWDRLVSLRHNLERLGVTSAIVTRHDAARFPWLDGTSPKTPFALGSDGFDKVLADVPCTCEGTTRKRNQHRHHDVDRYRRSVVQTQKGILRRALSLTRPGGLVVYATCTFAPEENEGVLSSIWPHVAEIVPVEPPHGLQVSPGITHWDGVDFRDDVVNAWRIWPHHNDSGGFFMALLRKKACEETLKSTGLDSAKGDVA
jgi:16S rRNA C967 or C1407 C5-methylase (RsmB/RsmF family)